MAGLLGQASPRASRLGHRVGHDPRLGPALRPLVRRRPAQRLPQRPGSPCRGRTRRQGRLPLGGRAGRHPHRHLCRPADRGAAVRQRPQGLRRRQGRPCRHLHADDPGAADGHARLRPHRRAALGRVRWLQPRCALRSHQRRRVQGAGHRRRRIPAGAPSMLKPNVDVALASTKSIEHVLVVKRVDQPVDMEEGRDVWWHEPWRARPPSAPASRWTARISSTCSTPPARLPSPRASCTPPAATSPRSPSPTSTSSTCIRTPTSTGAPPTSAGSPATATSSTDRSPTAPHRSSTRARPTPRARTGCGTSSSATASRSSTPRPPPSGPS